MARLPRVRDKAPSAGCWMRKEEGAGGHMPRPSPGDRKPPGFLYRGPLRHTSGTRKWSLPHLLQRAHIPHIISTEQALPRQQLVPQRAMICILALPVVRGLPSLTSTSASLRECKRAKTRVDELEAYRRVQPCQGQAQNPEQIRRVNDKHTLAHSLPPVQGRGTRSIYRATLPTFRLILMESDVI